MKIAPASLPDRAEGHSQLFAAGLALHDRRPEWRTVLELSERDGWWYARCWVDGRFAQVGVDRVPKVAVERLYRELQTYKGIDL